MSFLVIMPTYNELQNLRHAYQELFAHNPEIRLLIVDDNSPDGTGELADQIASTDERVAVLHRTQKQGLGPAYVAGFRWGISQGFDYLIEMDADGSHRAEDLPALLEQALTHDLVIGSRWVRGGRVLNWPLHRLAISRFGNLYVRLALGTKVRDMTAGFRVYRSTFLTKIDLATISAFGYSFQVEMAWRTLKLGGRVTEVPITFVEREQGQSKMTRAIVIEALTLVTKWGLQRLFRRG